MLGRTVNCNKQDAKFGYMLGIFIDSMGSIYVSDNSARIKKIDATGYVTNFAGNGIRRYKITGPLPATSKSLYNVFSVSCSTSGKCYLPMVSGAAIADVDSNTDIMQTAVGNGIVGTIPYSDGAAVGSCYSAALSGDYLYFSDYTFGTIKRMYIHSDPTSQPSLQPTSNPSGVMYSVIPSLQPSLQPSVMPTLQPSLQPTSNPSSVARSAVPTLQPSSSSLPTSSTAITSAQLSDDIMTIQVSLSQDLLSSATIGTRFPCSDVLLFGSVESYSCVWLSSTSLEVVMTAQGTFISVGSLMALQNQSLALEGVPVQRPQNVVTPQAVIRVSSSIQSCIDAQVDLSASTGSYGRAWQDGSSLSWLNVSSISLYTTNVSAQSVVTVPKSYLTNGESYVVMVNLCNVLGDCSEATADVTVNDVILPVVSIAGQAMRNIYVNSSQILSSTAYIQQCDGSRSYSNLQLSWSLTSATNRIITQSTGKSSLSIAAYTLNATQSYTATVSALYTLTGAMSSSSAFLQVLRSRLVSSISPSGTKQVHAGDAFVLSGQNSFDPDLLPSKRDSSSFVYTWSCNRLISTIPSGVCQLNVSYPINDHSQLRIQSNLSNVDSTHRICLQVAANATGLRLSPAFCTDVMVISAKAPLVSILNDPSSVQKVPTQKRLTLQGSIWSSTSCIVEWSVFETSIEQLVDASLLAPRKMIPESLTKRWVPINLFVLANVLTAGQSYSFSLGCNGTSVALTVVTNIPPRYGILTVSPDVGLELNTSFAIETALWQDIDLPLTYLFSFSTAGSGLQFSIGSRSENSLTSAVFSSGLINITVQAYDLLNAYSTAATFVIVQEAKDVTARLNSIDGLLQDTSNAAPDVFAQYASSISAALSTVSCTDATDCVDLHRAKCQATANTCGLCLTGYIGELGDSNLPCLASSASSNNIGEVSCVSDSDCPSSFYTCGSNGVCMAKQKECPLGCSGHGNCTFIDSSFGTVLTACTLSDTNCIAQCTCKSGYGGNGCDLLSEEVLRRASIKDTVISSLLNGLTDLLSSDDKEGTGVSGLATTVNTATTSAGSLSASAAIDAVDMTMQLFQAAVNTALSTDKVSSLLQTIDASVSSNTSSSMLTAALAALDSFASVVSASALSIDAPQQHIVNNFRLSNAVFDPSSTSSAQLTSPQSDLEQWSGKAISSITATLNVTRGISADSQQASIGLQLLEFPPKLLLATNNNSSSNSSLTSSILSVKYSNVSDLKLSFPLLSTGLEALISYQAMNITHRCNNDDYSSSDYICPGNQSLTFTCSGQAVNMTKGCPAPVLRCHSVDLAASVIQEDERCRLETQQVTTNGGGITAICRCDLSQATNTANHRQLLHSSTAAAISTAITMVVLVEYVGIDFATTFDASSALLSPNSVQKVYIVIILYAGLWSVGLCCYLILCHLCQQQATAKKQNTIKDSVYPQMSTTDTVQQPRGRERHHQRKSTNLFQKVDNNADGLTAREKIEQFRATLIQYLEAVFPAVFDDHSSLVRIAQELINNHSYLRLIFRPSKRRSMGLSIFQILTLKSSMLFLMALLYNLQTPVDDGTCPSYTTEAICLQRRTIFDNSISYCSWQPAGGGAGGGSGSCSYHQTTISFQAAIYCAVVMSIFTAVTTRPLEYLFALLNAPTAAQIETATALYHLQQVQHGLGDAMRRASTTVTGGISSRQRTTATAADGDDGGNEMMIVRDIPDRATQAQSQTRSSSMVFDAMELKNMLLARRQFDSCSSTNTLVVPGSSPEDGVRDAELTRPVVTTLSMRDWLTRACSGNSKPVNTKHEEAAAITTLSTLKEAILAYRNTILDNPKKLREFDRAWRLNAYAGNLHTILRQALLQELIIIKQESKRFEEQMKRTTPEDAGILMLQLFTRDLLGRDTPAAKIFEAKTEEDFQTVNVVSIRQKVLITAVLVGVNGFFAYFSLLQGLQRGLEWQRAYLFACILQIAAEILFNETLEVLWVHFLLPSTVSKEVQRVHRVLRENAASFSLLAASSSGAVSTGTTVALNAADFLFVSTNVAKHRIESGLLEAMIVLSYHTVLPGETVGKLLPKRVADHVRRDTNSEAEDKEEDDNSSRSNGSVALWWQLQRGSIWLAALARYLSIVAIFMLASLPFELHRVIIRFFEPFVLGGLIYAFYVVLYNPVLLAIICIVIGAGLLTSLYYAYRHEVQRRRELARIATSGLEEKGLERTEEKARRRRESSEDSTGLLHQPKGSKNNKQPDHIPEEEEQEILYFSEEEERKANFRIERARSNNKRRSSSLSGSIPLPAIQEVPVHSGSSSDNSSFSSKDFDSLSSEDDDEDKNHHHQQVVRDRVGIASRSDSIVSTISDIVMSTTGNHTNHSRSNSYDAGEYEHQPLVRNTSSVSRLRARTRTGSQNSQHSSPFNSYLSEDESDSGKFYLRNRVVSTASSNGGYQKL